MHDTFKIIELEKTKEEIKEGLYYDFSNNQLDKETNYILEVNSIPMGILFHNIEIDHLITEDFFKIIKKFKSNVSQNRGSIAGVLDENKLQNCYKKYLKDVTQFNKAKTRTVKNDKIKYAFSNPINSTILNNNSKYYIINKKEVDKHMKPLIKKINKVTKNYIKGRNNEKNFLDTFFSEIILNYGLRSSCHKDKFNSFKMGGVMVFTENPEFEYSNLNLPEFGVSIPLKTNKSLLYFNVVDTYHSNDILPEKWLKDRISLITYNKSK